MLETIIDGKHIDTLKSGSSGQLDISSAIETVKKAVELITEVMKRPRNELSDEDLLIHLSDLFHTRRHWVLIRFKQLALYTKLKVRAAK